VPLGNATGSCVGFTITGSSITVALLPLAHRRRLWSFFVGKGLRLGGHARVVAWIQKLMKTSWFSRKPTKPVQSGFVSLLKTDQLNYFFLKK
jgi:hypothetical protein